MNKIRVGIIRGGVGNNYENSLREGQNIISHLRSFLSQKWEPVDILIDKKGIWHVLGTPQEPINLLHKVDVVWNTAEPNFSEILNNLSIPCVGVRSFHNVIQKNKLTLAEHLKKVGIKMPKYVLLPPYQKDFDKISSLEKYSFQKAKEIFEKFGGPWIIKSYNNSSDLGIHVAKTFQELINAIKELASHNESILVEELIEGKKAGIHSVKGFRKNLRTQSEDFYFLPPFENRDGIIFTPGNFSSLEKEKLINLSKNICLHLGVEDYLCTNFILNPNRGIYLTELIFSPDFQKDSHLHKSCESIGLSTHKILEHILEKALRLNE